MIWSREVPMTFGEGLAVGREEGYEQGRRDCGLERLVIGFFVGCLVCAALVVALR